jgi:hypothetical protein
MESNSSSGFASLPNSSNNNYDDLPDPDEGFTLSLDDPNHPTNFTKPSASVDKQKKTQAESQESQYILGTLIVRVVSAKNLEVPNYGGNPFFQSNNSANPYASVKFGNSTQRSSEVFNNLDPVWPRHESMFMDVSLPITQLTHPQIEDYVASSAAAAAEVDNNSDSQSSNHNSKEDPYAGYKKPNSLLTVSIFHNPEFGRVNKLSGFLSGDSDDMFLGVASVDLTSLFNGKISTLDRWLPLHGNSPDSRGSVRIVCEYEPSDIPPKYGDTVNFTRFCHPRDLYPLEPGRPYKVDQVNGDIVLLSYQSPEGWVLSFQAHKNMLICKDRHVSALDSAQDELQTLGERLAYSPLVSTVTETAERVLDEGIVGVAGDIAKGGLSLVDRWFKGGLDTIIHDLQDVTNIDGRHNPDAGERLELSSPLPSSASLPIDTNDAEEEISPYLVENEEDEDKALPNMPPCPITGFPMVEPVVAADGHTYERAAIARWLKTSDKSPMTGSVLLHKELVPNYGLMSSVQEAAVRERQAAAAAARSKKPSPAKPQPTNAKKPPPPSPDETQDDDTPAVTANKLDDTHSQQSLDEKANNYTTTVVQSSEEREENDTPVVTANNESKSTPANAAAERYPDQETDNDTPTYENSDTTPAADISTPPLAHGETGNDRTTNENPDSILAVDISTPPVASQPDEEVDNEDKSDGNVPVKSEDS